MSTLGECLVNWRDIMSRLGGYYDLCVRGCHEYIGGMFSKLEGYHE